MDYIRLRGEGVSPGVAIGNVQLTERIDFSARRESIPMDKADAEMARLEEAVQRTRDELISLKLDVARSAGDEHAFIFDAHLLILQDTSLRKGLEKIIREELLTAEWAITQVHEKYARIFDAITDEYLKQRKSDVSDVLTKLYRNLVPMERWVPSDDGDVILVSHDLLPSEAATRLSAGNVLAVALDMGGSTSHTAILARSLNIPAVMGLRDITRRIKDGDVLIVDGTDGEIIINPPAAVRREFAGKRRKYDSYRHELQKTAKLQSVTLDDVDFHPLANIELPEEVNQALKMGAEGIGLFRSEFIYFQSQSLPSEEDHFQIYSRLAEAAAPHPVYIRTVDIGGEKELPQLKIAKEPNPALGLRAIRLSLRDRDLFQIQLRAILRASVGGNVRILIPMITEMEEIEEVKLLLAETKGELRRQKTAFDENIQLGAMIEVPAAAAVSDLIVREVDYLSIGTNDLIQYYLAVDRSNELVSYLFKPLHPAVLRLLRYILTAARKEGKPVTVCGEMAADPLCAIALLGLGLKNFSMNPIFIPRIKKALRSVEYAKVRRIVQKAMTLKSAQEIEEYLIEKILVNHPTALLMRDTLSS